MTQEDKKKKQNKDDNKDDGSLGIFRRRQIHGNGIGMERYGNLP